MLLLLVLLLSFSPSFPGQPQLEDLDPDLGDFDLDIAPRRIPRQVKAILVKVITHHKTHLHLCKTLQGYL
ncbi:hypothetical protein XENORESO_018434 [Xenotaenia resolanae]|uniref:Uncharacterized protein n=1 Tax=Xenotaenia resolanae TaxID=208358 RepID=A0ABV0VXJ2_9TELE